MKNTHIFDGMATALITPFTDDGIDTALFEKQIKRQLECGIDALVVCGTTGEGPTVDAQEHRELISAAVRAAGGNVPIIAGCGSNSTEHATRLARSAAEVGADALLTVTPYYNKANTEGLVRHCEAITSAARLPMILYNVPSRTGMDVSFEMYERLLQNKYIAASKEASSDITRFGRLVAKFGGVIDFYCGNDEMTLACLSVGGKGCISVASNAVPREMKRLYSLFSAGQNAEATRLQARLLPLMRALFADVNPIPIKAAMEHLGLDRGILRLPLCQCGDAVRAEVISSLDALGISPDACID